MLTPTGVTRSAYVAAIKAGNVTHARLVALNQEIVFTDQDIESGGIQLNSYLNGDEDLTIGKAVKDELTVNLFKTSKMDNLNWADDYRFDMGVEISGVTEWVTVGYYIGKRPEMHLGDRVIQFQLMDRMQMLEIPISDYMKTLDWTEGITVEEFYHGICDFCKVEYLAGNELPDIMARTYVKEPFSENGYTCREVIAMIAEACGCYARFTAAGKLKMVWFAENMNNYTIDRNHEFRLDIVEMCDIVDDSTKKTWADLEFYTWRDLQVYLWGELEGQSIPFKVNALNVRNMEEDSGVMIPRASSTNVYVIVDNPFLKTADQTDEESYLWPIFNRLSNFGTYVPLSVECVGNWLIEPGDVVTIETEHLTEIRFPIFTRVFSWNGSPTDSYEATGSLYRETTNPYVNQKMIEGGRMHVIRTNIDELYSQIQDELGNYTTIQQVSDAITLAVAKSALILYSKTAPTGINRDAEPYSSQQTYAAGDYCMHGGVSYRCLVNIGTPEAWTPAHWTVDLLPLTTETVWVDISDYLQTEADDYDSTATYAVGDLVTQEDAGQDKVFRCITAITTPEQWNSAHWELYERPVPRNKWYRWNGSAWVESSDSTVYARQSGINITADGVEINGEKYVKIQANDEGVWTYNENGLSYIGAEKASTFRFGQTSTEGIEAASNAGVFDYRHTESGDIHNAIKMNSTIAQWDSSIQNWRYTQSLVYWETIYLENTYIGALRPRIDSTGLIGKPGYYWARSYIYDMYGARMTLTGNFSAGGSVTAGSASFSGAVIAGSASVSGNATVSSVFTAGNVQSAIYRTDGTTMEFIPYYNEAPTQKGYHRAILWKPIDNAIHALTFCPNHASDDTYLYLGLPSRQIKRLYTEASPVVGSSRKIKHDIRQIGEVGDLIDKLKPSTFIYDMDGDEKTHSGFIYEEVENLFPTMCDNSNGGVGLALDELIPYLTKEIQSLRKRVAELENKEG